MIHDIAGWQRRFRAAPAVYVTVDREGNISQLYDSPEAAQFELDARPKEIRGPVKMNVHDAPLSRERWTR